MLLQNARNKDDTRGGLGINRGGCDNGALSLTVRRMCAEVAEMTDQQKADYKKECEEKKLPCDILLELQDKYKVAGLLDPG